MHRVTLSPLNCGCSADHARCRRDLQYQRLRATRRLRARLVLSLFVVSVLLSVACRERLPPRPYEDNAEETSAFKASPTVFPNIGCKGRRMLLVHSYHQGYRWVDTITEGVRSAIQGTGLELDIFCMDAKRHTDEAWKIDAGRRARRRVDEFRPDIILAADDDAQQYFATFYLNTALPVVFTGVDADPSKYGYPAANVTGVIERPHFKESLALAQQLHPIKRIAVLSCHDSTSILALGFMKQEQIDVEVVEWLMVDDFNDWKKAVERFNRACGCDRRSFLPGGEKAGLDGKRGPSRRCGVDLRARHRSDDRLSRLRDRRRHAGRSREVRARVWSNTGGVRPSHP